MWRLSSLIPTLLRDSTQGEGEPALALDKEITEANVVCNPGRQDTESTAGPVH